MGSTDIIKQNGFAKPSLTVTGIPTNGDTVYVRLWWRIGSNWNYTDYVYQAHVGGNQPNTTSAGGSTYYVDDDGSDITGDGTNKNPWKTINYGMGHRNFSLSPGDTLIVKNGNYSDPNGSPTKTINIGVRGTAKDWITIKSENKWGAVLDGKNHKIIKGVNFQPNTAYVRLENFEIKNYKASGISLNQANISNIYIYGNNIHHIAGSSGIATYKGTSKADATQHVTIDSNIIHNIGKSLESGGPYSFDHALYLRGHHQTVINNIFYNNKSGWSIHLSGHNRDLNDFYHYIANNTIIADNHDYRGGKFGGILVRASSVWIENNIIIVPTGKENSGGAINIYSEGVGCEDNLFINNNLTNANNVFAEHDKTRKHVCNSGVSISNNKVGQDAKKIFVSKNMPSALDTGYKLQIGSPAIDEGKAPVVPGLPGGKLIYDYRKTTARPKDSRYNIGAYEAR
ncbi:MAG: hypothetical protein SCALA701_23500 [Candidatus Scalindua sp.]|nr:MAG: hypothetical protein SCALA701_23500 [Candidatus Scalindua sp.]